MEDDQSFWDGKYCFINTKSYDKDRKIAQYQIKYFKFHKYLIIYLLFHVHITNYVIN